MPPDAVPLASRRGAGVVAATVCGSAVVFLDASVVNVALPTIGRQLDAGFGALAWTVNAYTLVLAALILLGGSLGDRLGRRRVFLVGVVWFAASSLLCALAPTVDVLIAARALAGVGGALLTPMSLAILSTVLGHGDRARAIGIWSGATTLASIAAPLVGGALVAIDWRWVFAINPPIAALAFVIALRSVPDDARHRAERSTRRVPLDVVGAMLGALALGAATWALITAGDRGASVAVLAALALAVVAGAGFVLRELRTPSPMVAPSLFTDRTFTASNAFTVVVYAALSGAGLLVTLQLQVSLGYSALRAGAAMLPASLLLGTLSSRAASLGQRLGARTVLTAGALADAAGFAVLAMVAPGDSYLTHVLPGVLAFGVGSTLFVATLTATVLAAAPQELAGSASGVNNAVARTAGLLSVAALPAIAGISGDAYTHPAALTPGYRTGMLICAGLVALGALVAAVGLPGRQRRQRRQRPSRRRPRLAPEGSGR